MDQEEGKDKREREGERKKGGGERKGRELFSKNYKE